MADETRKHLFEFVIIFQNIDAFTDVFEIIIYLLYRWHCGMSLIQTAG